MLKEYSLLNRESKGEYVSRQLNDLSKLLKLMEFQ